MKDIINFTSETVCRSTTTKALIKVSSFDLLGIRVDGLSSHELVEAVSDAVACGQRYIIGNHNLHSLYMWFHEPRMREFYRRANYIHIDGMSLVLLARIMGLPLKRNHRTGYMDFLPLLAVEAVKRGWRIFYVGSRPGIAPKAALRLRKQYPGLQIATHHGHFNAETAGAENQAILAEIKAFAPDILMVGMGMPRQEVWVLENEKDITAHAVFCCGALMDYVAGEIPTPPRWIGQLGFEWLYRLLCEPARLRRRYLVEPWSVMGELVRLYFSSPHLKSNRGAAGNE